MIGHGCGVSHCPQFYYQHFEKYQVLPQLLRLRMEKEIEESMGDILGK